MFEKIKALVKEKDICVLSTVSEDARPHCSLMAYVSDEKCREIYMATHSATRKYKNLMHNSSVSLLIDSREITPRQQAQALTVSGAFQPIDDVHKRDLVEAGQHRTAGALSGRTVGQVYNSISRTEEATSTCREAARYSGDPP